MRDSSYSFCMIWKTCSWRGWKICFGGRSFRLTTVPTASTRPSGAATGSGAEGVKNLSKIARAASRRSSGAGEMGEGHGGGRPPRRAASIQKSSIGAALRGRRNCSSRLAAPGSAKTSARLRHILEWLVPASEGAASCLSRSSTVSLGAGCWEPVKVGRIG